MTALVAGVMTILMGVIAKQPFAMAAGLGVNALLATTIASTPGLTWPAIMGLVVWAGVLMTILVLTGFPHRSVQRGPRIAQGRNRRRYRLLHRLHRPRQRGYYPPHA